MPEKSLFRNETGFFRHISMKILTEGYGFVTYRNMSDSE